MWDKMNSAHKPEMDVIAEYVNDSLWNELCGYLEENYGARPVIEYSKCAVPGWNVKYRKAGRGLCTLYPMEGYYTALVVIGERERVEAELLLASLTQSVQALYRETKTGMGQKWLMIDVCDKAVLADVKKLIGIRMAEKKK